MQLDPDEVRDYRHYSFMNPRRSRDTDPLKIFLAVLAAILVAWFLRAIYIEWQVRYALKEFNQQMALIEANMHRDMQRNQIRAKLEAEERTRALQEKAYQERLAKHQLKLEEQAAIERGINDRSKKEQAWTDYYKPAKGCEPSNDNKDLMKCANDYARAKKSFEVQWANEQLSQSH